MSSTKACYIDLPPKLLADIELFQEEECCQRRSEAIRRLIQMSLRRWKAQKRQEIAS